MPTSAKASPRIQYTINENWKFVPGNITDAFQLNYNDSNWKSINFPHTWNASDVKDDVPGYYRDATWYRRKVPSFVRVPTMIRRQSLELLPVPHNHL